MKFTEFDLNEKLMQGIADAGFTECMPVQEETLVHSLKTKDVEVQSQTGTGKTAAFLITIFQHFLELHLILGSFLQVIHLQFVITLH